MPGLVPGIHVLASHGKKDVDGRVKPGHDGNQATYLKSSANAYSSGSTFTIEAPWLLPAQKLTGLVELSTKTRRILVERGSR
jgi:hypothetical protein